MATTKGPAFGLDAAGSIGRTMVFSNWKGRSYVKYSAPVKNPKTAPQVARRAMMRFLATNFGTLDPADLVTWYVLAAQRDISPYNAWCQYNMQRWARYLCPTKAYPDNDALTAYNIETANATALNRSIVLTWSRTETENDWGYIIYRSTAFGFPKAIANVIRVGFWDTIQPSEISWTDGPLTPDTYYYKWDTFSEGGLINTNYSGQKSATIT